MSRMTKRIESLMFTLLCLFALLLPIQTATSEFEADVKILGLPGFVPWVDLAFDPGNVPEPVPPPDDVRNFFKLDPFYQQWINVGGLPVLASAEVNPYAVKEAAYLIGQMIGHRPNVLRAMAQSKARFSVIGHTEIITEIPEYRSDPRPDFLVFHERGWGGTEGATVSSSDENVLNYPGTYGGPWDSVLIHEFAHGIHLLGLNRRDPTFDVRLKKAYDTAMEKGLWQGTYASSDRREYWAEATQAWFNPKGPGSFSRFGNTRRALKAYDPEIALLLFEVYWDRPWQYTPVATRTHLQHLQGFDPQASPIFEGFPELEAVYRQLRDSNSDGDGAWVNLKAYRPNQLPRLAHSNVHGGLTTVIFVNFSQADVLVYWVEPDGTEGYWTRVPPGYIRGTPSRINQIWLVKDANGRNLAVFQAEEKTGRAGVGAAPHTPRHVVQGDSSPQVLGDAFQRPPMYWIDTEAGTLHRLIGDSVENLLPSVQNATSLAVDMDGGKLYWTEKTGNKTGRIRCASLNGTPNVRLVKELTSVPQSLAIDLANDKLYVTNSWGKVQRLNIDGSNFQPNLITELEVPDHIAVGVASRRIYWTEKNRIRRAFLDGSNPETLATGSGQIGGIAIADGKLYWTQRIGKSEGSIQHANLDGTNVQGLVRFASIPLGITIDPIGRKLYWTSFKGRIQCVNLDGSNFETLVVGLGAPAGITLAAHEIHSPKVVKIPDQNLAKAVRQELGLAANTPITEQALQRLTTLIAPERQIKDLTGLEHAIGLVRLSAWENQIQDVRPLSQLKSLRQLHFQANQIQDITALAGLTELRQLHLQGNRIRDIRPLKGLTKLESLWLAGNPLQNTAPLEKLLKQNPDMDVDIEVVGVGAAPTAAAQIPAETAVLANFPNPFNPETWIPYELATDTDVSITIYNTQGVVVRVLPLGHQLAGYYTGRSRAAYWDGRNNVGERVASGVYFYTFTADEFTATRKMLITK